MQRNIAKKVKGMKAIDGAGVHLVRVLGRHSMKDYDPILMLDSFDSTDPDDYIRGFPFHPHRGIETITYLKRGSMTHRDSLGNSGTITDGQVQWMTAGSGIMHEEMPQASERMLGVQLWLNLPKEDKMCRPRYVDITDIPRVDEGNSRVDVISGKYKDTEGHQGDYIALDFYHIEMDKGAALELKTDPDKQVILFTLEGDAVIAEEAVEEKTAVQTSEGDTLKLEAPGPASILFLQAKALNEPISWGGPIVMNTKEELDLAFKEFRDGNFLKEKPIAED